MATSPREPKAVRAVPILPDVLRKDLENKTGYDCVVVVSVLSAAIWGSPRIYFSRFRCPTPSDALVVPRRKIRHSNFTTCASTRLRLHKPGAPARVVALMPPRGPAVISKKGPFRRDDLIEILLLDGMASAPLTRKHASTAWLLLLPLGHTPCRTL